MNKKGQALVEFVIILPVFLLLTFCVVDFARIISLKNELENMSSDVSNLYQNGKNDYEIKSLLEKDDIKITIDNEGDYIKININKKINPITPGLNKIPTKVFDVNVNRIIRKNSEISTTTSIEDIITTKDEKDVEQ